MINPLELAPNPLDKSITLIMQTALNDKYSRLVAKSEKISLSASVGPESAFLQASLGDKNKAHVFDIFAEQCAWPEEKIWDLLDFLDGVLAEFFEHDRDGWLELDFSERDFEGQPLLVRHALVNYAAEKAATAFLQEKGEI